ncbi:hypothetical protein [Massilia sp. Root418]|nr:hypothetical protein [Massilia sp. Root418]
MTKDVVFVREVWFSGVNVDLAIMKKQLLLETNIYMMAITLALASRA